MIPLIELELRKLGLTEKEVKVYIATKAGLTRPTTYETITTAVRCMINFSFCIK